MSNLKKYKSSSLNNIRIKFNGEVIKFNLFEEVTISQNMIDKEIRVQPSHYAFLLLLHKKLLTQFEDLKLERTKIYSQKFLQAKSELHNGRPLNDDMCKAHANSDEEFVMATKRCIKAKDDADTIYACVKAFEQRKDLLQTLSSNLRKEAF